MFFTSPVQDKVNRTENLTNNTANDVANSKKYDYRSSTF